MTNIIKIAIASDLHCKHSDGKNASEVFTYLTSNLMKIPIKRNPIEALKEVIKVNNLSSEILLCPGDITDKSDSQGLISGWQYLEDLQKALGSNILAATVGNHDVDSRKLSGKDPFDSIKRFTLNFPTFDNELNQHFWAKNYCIINEEEYDLLIYNSSNNHIDEHSCKESLITQTTLENIENDLKKLKIGKIRIAMCHHHPIKHSNMDYKDGDSIDKGDELIKILHKNDFTILIHGHKHDPRLNYHFDLPIFGVGSFSSMMNLLDLKADNTFHLIEIENQKMGIIKTWVYTPIDGWIQKPGTYFPCLTGFGSTKDINDLAEECANWIKIQNNSYVPFPELVKVFPDLKYLIPSQQEKLHNLLLTKYSLEIIPKLTDGAKAITLMH